jgi:C4-dicarboxylate transporter, DcuC family
MRGSPAAVVIAALDLAIVVALVGRGVDVRLPLLLGALPLFLATTGASAFLTSLVGELANPATVVPICSAMGFAYVLRVTGCDQHLVRLLIEPLRRARFLLIPGGIIAGYLVNSTIVSQAGTAAVLGPLLIPLLRAGGLDAASAGSILLLGSSMGGELFNPGAVEMRKLAELTGQTGAQVVAKSASLNVLACSVALAVFWLLALRRNAAAPAGSTPAEPPDPGATAGTTPPRVNLAKAMVPILPILLLSIDSLIGPNALTKSIDGPAKILGAMLIGAAVAALLDRGCAGKLPGAFFEGAGFAYHHVISLIVVASTFARGVQESGLIEIAVNGMSGWPALALAVTLTGPWALAVVSGTGIAPAVSIMQFFVPVASDMGVDPMKMGTLAAMGAHFGRTMSPAAAVVAMSARLSLANPSDLIRRVAGPLMAGGVALLLATLFGLV